MNLVIRFVLLRSKVRLRMNEDEFFHKDFRFKMADDYYKMVGIIVYSFQSNKINCSSYTIIHPIYCSRKILKFIGLFAIKTVLARFVMLQVYFWRIWQNNSYFMAYKIYCLSYHIWKLLSKSNFIFNFELVSKTHKIRQPIKCKLFKLHCRWSV